MKPAGPGAAKTRPLLTWGLIAGAWGLSLAQWLMPPANAAADSGHHAMQELTVQRINIADASGKPRLVIANAERFPNP